MMYEVNIYEGENKRGDAFVAIHLKILPCELKKVNML